MIHGHRLHTVLFILSFVFSFADSFMCGVILSHKPTVVTLHWTLPFHVVPGVVNSIDHNSVFRLGRTWCQVEPSSLRCIIFPLLHFDILSCRNLWQKLVNCLLFSFSSICNSLSSRWRKGQVLKFKFSFHYSTTHATYLSKLCIIIVIVLVLYA